MQLSRFFTVAEIAHSDTAQSLGIPNEPGAAETESLRALCAAVLDPLRQSIGQAIRINSGYRSPKLNKHVGGARDSQHVRGEAADIESRGVSPSNSFRESSGSRCLDQLIYEDKSATVKWVHVSRTTGDNRGQILKAKFAPGQPTTYLEMTAEAGTGHDRAQHASPWRHADVPANRDGRRARGGRAQTPPEKEDLGARWPRSGEGGGRRPRARRRSPSPRSFQRKAPRGKRRVTKAAPRKAGGRR